MTRVGHRSQRGEHARQVSGVEIGQSDTALRIDGQQPMIEQPGKHERRVTVQRADIDVFHHPMLDITAGAASEPCRLTDQLEG